jgi:hypothetical protein
VRINEELLERKISGGLRPTEFVSIREDTDFTKEVLLRRILRRWLWVVLVRLGWSRRRYKHGKEI